VFNGVLLYSQIKLMSSTAPMLLEQHGVGPMKMLLAVLAFAALLASPVLAQSYSQEFGSGNVLPNHSLSQTGEVAVRDGGANAFAMVPHSQLGSDRYDPAATGGGSVGYNRQLEIY
jgi:hypothetical protein